MALDHRRLIRPGKKILAEFFAFDKFTLQNLDLLTSRAFEREARAGSYHTSPDNHANDFEKVYTKSCQQIWVRVNQPFI